MLEKFYHFISSPNYQPLNAKGLARKLKVPSGEQAEFIQWLKQEEEAGRIVSIRQGIYVLPQSAGLVAGVLSIHPRGFGFLVSQQGEDIYVAAEDTGTAFHGDRVLVRLKEPSSKKKHRGSKKGQEDRLKGKVIRILQRARAQVVGVLAKTQYFYYIVPDEVRIPHDIYVPEPQPPIPLGHKVVVKLKDWPSRHVNPEGEIVEVLGAPSEEGVDIISLIKKFELPEEFPPEVMKEAKGISNDLDPKEVRKREDFRSDFVFTIDPETAKDFDDALSYRLHTNGDFEIFIHIADVSYYVKPGSAMDEEAKRRGNSVYLVDRVLPMLPEKLSNQLCSLQSKVDRFVRTVVVRLSSQGGVKKVRFTSGVIHSRCRLTYAQALEPLRKKTKAKTEISQHLEALHKMAQLLRKRRFEQGALNLDFPEVCVRLDERGKAIGLEKAENDESHQLVEEFMLLANEVVAKHLKNEQRVAVYRVHPDPDPSKLQEFREQVKNLGISIGDLTQKGEIQKLLKKIRGLPEESALKIGLLKSLKRAIYLPSPEGHYGLAKANYTHFTSPIRRYADLVVHRALFPDKKNKAVLASYEANPLAVHLSQRERIASEAETESIRLKKLEYFTSYLGDAKALFSAIILEVRHFGLLVELPEYCVQGAIRISEIPGDFFVWNERRCQLEGKRTQVRYRLGQALEVGVKEVNFIKKEIEFFIPHRKDFKKKSSSKKHHMR